MFYRIINANTFFLWALSYLNYKKYDSEIQRYIIFGFFGGFWAYNNRLVRGWSCGF